MRRTIMSVVAIASLLLMSSLLSAEAQPPDATLRLHTASVAVGVGYSWGGGILTFQGKEYPFRVDGLSAGDVGISSADATGNVYNLTKLEDFNGNYAAVSAGAALAGGGSIATMRNQHGVVIDLTGISQGANLTLGVQGVKITLQGPYTALQGN
jgi:hypothetical protein